MLNIYIYYILPLLYINLFYLYIGKIKTYGHKCTARNTPTSYYLLGNNK